MQATEYYINQILSLNIEGQPAIQIKVKRLHQPWTLSCGMVVDILDGTDNSQIGFLKLFDRRWVYQLRSDKKIPPWTTQIEESYNKFIQSGEEAIFLDKLNHEPGFADNDDSWNGAENESFLSQELLTLYNAETATYEALKDHQGKTIPSLLAKATLDTKSSDFDEHQRQVKGILLEYLPGFTLSALDQHVPQVSWQAVVDEAVHITQILAIAIFSIQTFGLIISWLFHLQIKINIESLFSTLVSVEFAG